MKIIITFVLGAFIATTIKAQELQDATLVGMWRIKKYKVGKKFYPPSKKEKNDFLLFRFNKTFQSQSENVIENGTWLFDSQTKTISFIDKKNEELKAKIIRFENNQIALIYQLKDLENIIFYYQKK